MNFQKRSFMKIISHRTSIQTVTGRFANESFRQRSVRKRVGSIRKRPIVSSQTSYITRTLYAEDTIKLRDRTESPWLKFHSVVAIIKSTTFSSIFQVLCSFSRLKRSRINREIKITVKNRE